MDFRKLKRQPLFTSPEYERYLTWCRDRNLEPANFETWEKVVNGIPNNQGVGS